MWHGSSAPASRRSITVRWRIIWPSTSANDRACIASCLNAPPRKAFAPVGKNHDRVLAAGSTRAKPPLFLFSAETLHAQ
jgi:hypothetical protein